MQMPEAFARKLTEAINYAPKGDPTGVIISSMVLIIHALSPEEVDKLAHTCIGEALRLSFGQQETIEYN